MGYANLLHTQDTVWVPWSWFLNDSGGNFVCDEREEDPTENEKDGPKKIT